VRQTGYLTEAVCLAMLLVGSFFSFPWTRRRYIHYCFAFVAFAAFCALGPRAAILVVVAGVVGALSQMVLAGDRPEKTDRVASLLAATAAAALGMEVTHGARWALGMREYPLSFGRPGDLGRFTLSLVILYVVFSITKEALILVRRWLLGAREETQPGVETNTSLYTLGGIVGAPMQFAAYAVYANDAILAWTCVMLWSLLVNAVIAREVARMRHVGVLMRELGTKERLAAIGEVTARIVHQTRHQLGLIGITVHRIERRISALPDADAAVVRGELAKLGEVQEELRRMLTRDLRGDGAAEASPTSSPRPESASFASITRSVTSRLEALAAARGVRVDAGELAVAEAFSPRDPENVAQALFNVIENAIVAARYGVRVAATTRDGGVVLAVIDDGPGMQREVLARATEPFVTTKPDGTGMGLAIARAAVCEEGGTLRLANDVGGGLRVELMFPGHRPEATTVLPRA
jgi:signal transduction histidine kinase